MEFFFATEFVLDHKTAAELIRSNSFIIILEGKELKLALNNFHDFKCCLISLSAAVYIWHKLLHIYNMLICTNLSAWMWIFFPPNLFIKMQYNGEKMY